MLTSRPAAPSGTLHPPRIDRAYLRTMISRTPANLARARAGGNSAGNGAGMIADLDAIGRRPQKGGTPC